MLVHQNTSCKGFAQPEITSKISNSLEKNLCEFCGKGFTRKDNLIVHQNTSCKGLIRHEMNSLITQIRNEFGSEIVELVIDPCYM
jgi:hypothetical protein